MNHSNSTFFFCFAIFNRWDLHFTAEYDTFYPSRRAVGGSEQVSITCPWSGIIRIGYCNHINIGKNQKKKKHKHTHQLTKSSDRLWNLDGAVEIEDEFGFTTIQKCHVRRVSTGYRTNTMETYFHRRQSDKHGNLRPEILAGGQASPLHPVACSGPIPDFEIKMSKFGSNQPDRRGQDRDSINYKVSL